MFLNKSYRRRRIAATFIHTLREGPRKPNGPFPPKIESFNYPTTSKGEYQRSKLTNRNPTIQRQKDSINIPLIPRHLHEHLFGKRTINDELLALMVDENCKENQLELTPLKSEGNLNSHFEQLGAEQFSSYEKLLEKAMKVEKIPKLPEKWAMNLGWTIYDEEGKSPQSIEFPNERLLFFDVEVCVNDGKLPAMAVALSPTNWYSWCSDRLVNVSSELPEFIHLNHLIPLGDEIDDGNNDLKNGRLVIGHNVAFDRQYVRGQYLPKQSTMRFWCTMSMHIACSGMADHQRSLYEKTRLNDRDFMLSYMTEESEGNIRKFTPKFQKLIEEWKKKTCKNSLVAVHNKYCTEEIKLDKNWQTFFLKKNIEEIRENAQDLFKYCASDVKATFEVFQKIYPKFRKRFPSPITYCGMLEMANTYLPITGNWHRFFHKCEQSSSLRKNEAAKNLIGLARQIIDDLDVKNENGIKKYELDAWMWQSDWSRPNKRPQWPNWYWALFQKIGGAAIDLDELDAKTVKMLSREVPRLFGLCYKPYPLMFKQKFGWGFLVPKGNVNDSCELPEFEEIKMDEKSDFVKMPVKSIYALIEENKMVAGEVIITNKSTPAAQIGQHFNFYRLPHPSGKELNVGTPFAKSNKLNFDNFEQGIISPFRFSKTLEDFLQTRSTTHFWGNYRNRYNEQLPVWLDENEEIGAILPTVTPSGTVTRRAVHKLWLVSTNPKKEIIGSDLKSMVQCASGWSLVGADVDSQEQWIAALFGDSIHESKRAGATSFSRMLLAGNKTNQSDLHSVVAKEVGITRDQAKVLNYARLYGSGIQHAEYFLKTQGIVQKIAKELAKKLFAKTKGRIATFYELNDIGNEFFKKFLNQAIVGNGSKYLVIDGKYFIKYPDFVHEFEDWLLITNKNENKRMELDDLIKSSVKLYTDGYESSTFNFLSLKSNELYPQTPILKCRLSEALEPIEINDENAQEARIFNQMYKRTIINWFVQSSAVDFLHMLLVCMRWLCEYYKIPVRFVISIHDEVRYLVPEDDKYRCALALTLCNMYVRAAISQAFGVNELPMSIAFFSQVDIDTVLRKDVNMECFTPDGKLVTKGEALNIGEIIQKTGGSLQKNATNSASI